jgi:Na+/proline symporter
MNAPESYSPAALKTLEILERNRMAWIAFYYVIGLNSLFFVALIFAIFTRKEWEATTILGALNGLIGWCLKTVLNFLFPSKRPE